MSTINVADSQHFSLESNDNLEQVIAVCEQAIAQGDTDRYLYWYLGLAYLIDERETEAQATWFVPFVEADQEEEELFTEELSNILARQIDLELSQRNSDQAWLICQYLRELKPLDFNNLLRSILLSIETDNFAPNLLSEWQAVEVITANLSAPVSIELLVDTIRAFLDVAEPSTLDFIHHCLIYLSAHQQSAIAVVSNLALNHAHRGGNGKFNLKVLALCQQEASEVGSILKNISLLCSNEGLHQQAIDTAHQFYDRCLGLADRAIGNYTILRAVLTAGNWQNIDPIGSRHYQLLSELIESYPSQLPWEINQYLLNTIVFLPYIADRPEIHRVFQNKIAEIYTHNLLLERMSDKSETSPLKKPAQVIRIGYLGSTFRRHSVGWLSRWLWQYHDREKFQIFLYGVNQNPADPFYQQWFRDRSDISYCFGTDAQEIANQIRADRVDILVDLDSLTLNITVQVLAAKPAPMQVTWLGWDATGLSSVDYFLADRYVLPERAQDYYREQIWRLPSTYLAVDGFEVGESTISRQSLAIPDDAIIYWSAQTGYKRHPDTVRSQMRILKAVPNSYFLIKGISDREIIQDFFAKIALEEGVSCDRLRFLDLDRDEYTHRANLAIADIVLDTFPYNGATTTLETLWMGIPLVTRVGQQFAARNSYTFMINAGIEEGIAWTDEEYIEWGIRLGKEPELRQHIQGKLKASRDHAPVWNAKQFTRDVEDAYRQMWAIYQQSLN
jgi:predicted O-linked N-acetylglucosamine transferase (SPINDLY family)